LRLVVVKKSKLLWVNSFVVALYIYGLHILS
jgi:hypothetical protein